MIPLFMILTRPDGRSFAVNVNEIHSIQSEAETSGTIVTTNRERFYISDSFDAIMDAIQAASVEQYDKLSQTVVIKNK